MQDNYTTKAKHLTIDSRRLIERWKKEQSQALGQEIKLDQGTKGKDSPLS
ncbi:transposase-like protein, IS1239 [Streptococcus pneumoniae]|nr:transposase-like protein, IS1239 [Streptococcus pneumoniae]VFI05350.1 transposase-like protein, IS1239 [Streptococcus pneumoniae]